MVARSQFLNKRTYFLLSQTIFDFRPWKKCWIRALLVLVATISTSDWEWCELLLLRDAFKPSLCLRRTIRMPTWTYVALSQRHMRDDASSLRRLICFQCSANHTAASIACSAARREFDQFVQIKLKLWHAFGWSNFIIKFVETAKLWTTD